MTPADGAGWGRDGSRTVPATRRAVLAGLSAATVGFAGCSGPFDLLGGGRDAAVDGGPATGTAADPAPGPASEGDRGTVVLDNRRPGSVFATVAVSVSGTTGDGTVASVTRTFPPGRTRLDGTAVSAGQYDVVVETEAGRRATGTWRVSGALADLTVRVDRSTIDIRQSVACTPDCPPVSAGGRVDPPLSAWPIGGSSADPATPTGPGGGATAPAVASGAPAGRRVSVVNVDADDRTIDVTMAGAGIRLRYAYRLPPGVEVRLPPAPVEGDLRVAVTPRSDGTGTAGTDDPATADAPGRFEATLAPGAVAVPLAVDADGVSLDCETGGADLLVSVGAVGARLVEATAVDPAGDERGRAVLVDSGDSRLVEDYLDAPGVYDVTVRAWEATGATYRPAGRTRTTAVVCDRRRLAVTVRDGVTVSLVRPG
jgi:hypothetical protein